MGSFVWVSAVLSVVAGAGCPVGARGVLSHGVTLWLGLLGVSPWVFPPALAGSSGHTFHGRVGLLRGGATAPHWLPSGGAFPVWCSPWRSCFPSHPPRPGGPSHLPWGDPPAPAFFVCPPSAPLCPTVGGYPPCGRTFLPWSALFTWCTPAPSRPMTTPGSATTVHTDPSPFTHTFHTSAPSRRHLNPTPSHLHLQRSTLHPSG